MVVDGVGGAATDRISVAGTGWDTSAKAMTDAIVLGGAQAVGEA